MFKVVLYFRDVRNRITRRTYQLTTSDAAQALIDANLLANEAQDNTRSSVYRYRVVYDAVPSQSVSPQSDSNIDYGLTLRAFSPSYRGFLTMQIPDPVAVLVRSDGSANLLTEFGALNHFLAYFLTGSIAKFEDGKQTPRWIDGVLDR
jgi:hypothetical protein